MQNAWNRKSYGSKHPLFSGEPGMWNKILVKVMPKSTIRFLANETTKIITSANRLSATESDVVVNPALPATHGVERALLLGGQALAHVLGRNNSTGSHFSWYEKRYNFDRASELAGDCMDGMAKMRFQFKNSQGLKEPTDLGVMVIDSAVKL